MTEPEEEELHTKPGCLLGDYHDGPCMDDDDIAEEKFKARDYDGWADL